MACGQWATPDQSMALANLCWTSMPLRILLILGALSAFGPLAIDFYLPSFPTLARVFATDVEHVQLSLSAYFAGLAIGQLIYGLLAGVLLFSLASLACALAPSLEWLIGARFVQALGGCAGMVVSRAVVRDLCDPINSAKAFSQDVGDGAGPDPRAAGR